VGEVVRMGVGFCGRTVPVRIALLYAFHRWDAATRV
jgi:hypothetical protein